MNNTEFGIFHIHINGVAGGGIVAVDNDFAALVSRQDAFGIGVGEREFHRFSRGKVHSTGVVDTAFAVEQIEICQMIAAGQLRQFDLYFVAARFQIDFAGNAAVIKTVEVFEVAEQLDFFGAFGVEDEFQRIAVVVELAEYSRGIAGAGFTHGFQKRQEAVFPVGEISADIRRAEICLLVMRGAGEITQTDVLHVAVKEGACLFIFYNMRSPVAFGVHLRYEFPAFRQRNFFAGQFSRDIFAVNKYEFAFFLQFQQSFGEAFVLIVESKVQALNHGDFWDRFEFVDSDKHIIVDHAFQQLFIYAEAMTGTDGAAGFGQQRDEFVLEIHALCQFHDIAAVNIAGVVQDHGKIEHVGHGRSRRLEPFFVRSDQFVADFFEYINGGVTGTDDLFFSHIEFAFGDKIKVNRSDRNIVHPHDIVRTGLVQLEPDRHEAGIFGHHEFAGEAFPGSAAFAAEEGFAGVGDGFIAAVADVHKGKYRSAVEVVAADVSRNTVKAVGFHGEIHRVNRNIFADFFEFDAVRAVGTFFDDRKHFFAGGIFPAPFVRIDRNIFGIEFFKITVDNQFGSIGIQCRSFVIALRNYAHSGEISAKILQIANITVQVVFDDRAAAQFGTGAGYLEEQQIGFVVKFLDFARQRFAVFDNAVVNFVNGRVFQFDIAGDAHCTHGIVIAAGNGEIGGVCIFGHMAVQRQLEQRQTFGIEKCDRSAFAGCDLGLRAFCHAFGSLDSLVGNIDSNGKTHFALGRNIHFAGQEFERTDSGFAVAEPAVETAQQFAGGKVQHAAGGFCAHTGDRGNAVSGVSCKVICNRVAGVDQFGHAALGIRHNNFVQTAGGVVVAESGFHPQTCRHGFVGKVFHGVIDRKRGLVVDKFVCFGNSYVVKRSGTGRAQCETLNRVNIFLADEFVFQLAEIFAGGIGITCHKNAFGESVLRRSGEDLFVAGAFEFNQTPAFQINFCRVKLTGNVDFCRDYRQSCQCCSQKTQEVFV